MSSVPCTAAGLPLPACHWLPVCSRAAGLRLTATERILQLAQLRLPVRPTRARCAAPSCHRARGTPWQSPRRTRVCFDDRLQCLHRAGSDTYNFLFACVFKTTVAYVRAIERGCPAALVCPTSAKWLGLRPPRVSTLCPAVADAESAPLDAGRALHFLHALGHASRTTAIMCGTFDSVSAPHTQTE